MKNLAKSVICTGVSVAGFKLFNTSLFVKNNKIAWNPKLGIPGEFLLVYGLMFAGKYAAQANISSVSNRKTK